MNENEVSKWQLWLLAHLPRPMVVLLVMPAHLVAAFVTWLKGNDGENLANAIFVVFTGAWALGGFLLGAADSAFSGVVLAIAGFFVGMLALGVICVVLLMVTQIFDWYSSVDKSLPRREKKDED